MAFYFFTVLKNYGIVSVIWLIMKINGSIQKYNIGCNQVQINKSVVHSKAIEEPERKSALMTSNAYYNMQQCRLSFASSKYPIDNNISKQDRFKGCLIGGAIGDAFGAKIEWFSIDRIKNRYGDTGLRYIPKTQGIYRVTDDTQMTLFTCEGLLNSYRNNGRTDVEPDYNIIYSSYKNWYDTQTKSKKDIQDKTLLMNEQSLYVKRGPGNTCMNSLKNGIPGSVEKPINDSMGNGGLMKTAPIGLMYNKNPELAFEVGAKTSALTHGHPNAYIPAGFLSSLIADLVNEVPLEDAINNSIKILKNYEGYESTLDCIEKAIEYSKKDMEDVVAIESIGYGGRGDEALGIALYSVLKYPNDIKKALTAAVNHSGDSDSTGAIAGNIIGASIGVNAIPSHWIDKLEHADLLTIMSLGLEISEKDNGNASNENKFSSIEERTKSDIAIPLK